ncbi:MAG: DUF72 domain-containing protein [Acidobacteria bacterium]|nr:MAG: DUF72 domain-containing protein [Acidobacteriota bacterium]
MRARIIIGTSGWHYKHWCGLLYPKKCPPSQWFDLYAQSFDTVEVNNTFYRLPTEDALRRWHDAAPAGFCFAVKASRFITHIKRLRDPENAIALFFSRVELLGHKLGPILFQLPPNWHVDAERLADFLRALPLNHRYVFEFRDESWNTPPIFDLLRRHKIAFCIHDWRGSQSPVELTADFTYIRFHGATGKYQGNYDDHLLRSWAERIGNWTSHLSRIYVYFNNDQHGYAVSNAQTLQQLLNRDLSRAA